MHPETLCGWFGKLPSIGDFASRRLPPAIIDTWDEWLSEGLQGWREADPDGWLDDYLAGPSWRFVLMPGALLPCVAQAPVAGVLMPSVDRVGRYFPFTLLLPLRQLPIDASEAESLLGHLVSMNDLALDAMEQDWTIEQLEAQLERLAQQLPQGFSTSRHPRVAPELGEILAGPDLSRWLAAASASSFAQKWYGHSLWWCDRTGGHRLRVELGLPRGPAFRALFLPARPPLLDMSIPG